MFLGRNVYVLRPLHIGVGTNPVDVSITPDGARAYVTNSGSNSVSVIDTSANAVTTTVPVGANPVNAAIF